jgi:hypothetical protein
VNAAGGLAGDAAFAESSERLRLLAPAAPCRRLLLLLPAEDAVVAEAPVAHARLRRRRVAVVVRAVPIRAGRTYIMDYLLVRSIHGNERRGPASRTRDDVRVLEAAAAAGAAEELVGEADVAAHGAHGGAGGHRGWRHLLRQSGGLDEP